MNQNPKNGDRLTKIEGQYYIWDRDFNSKTGPYVTEFEARAIIDRQDRELAAGTRA